MTLDGNRNALLALHFRDGGTTHTAAHVTECAECRAYLRMIEEVEAELVGAGDEKPPDGLRDAVLSHALAARQAPRPAPSPRTTAAATPLLALLPVMALLVTVAARVGAAVERWPYWQEMVPQAPPLAAIAAAVIALLLAGGLVSLAIAPVLVLESRKT